MMQSLKKYCLFVLLAVASTAQGQSFRDIEELKEMRPEHQDSWLTPTDGHFRRFEREHTDSQSAIM